MIVDTLCWKCKSVTGKGERKRGNEPIIERKLCCNCMLLHKQSMVDRNRSPEMRELQSDRMKHSNPSFTPKMKRDRELRYKYPERFIPTNSNFDIHIHVEKMVLVSIRMRCDNPMKNIDIVNKGKTTLRDNIQKGVTVYKKGINHHLWKGNRNFNQTVRVRLYPVWTYRILERDEFRCVKCGEKNKCQVHHIRPLRDIIQIVLDLNGKPNLDDSRDWEYHIKTILDEHNLSDGITLCKNCHYEVDDRFYGGQIRCRNKNKRKKDKWK